MYQRSQQDRAQTFLHRAKEKFGNQYDYSEVKYVNMTTYVKFLCPDHGAFYTSPKNFLAVVKQTACPSCRCSASQKPKILEGSSQTNGCNSDNFNVRGGTKKHQGLLLEVFGESQED